MTLRRFFERLIWLCMLPLVVLGVALSSAQLRALKQQRSLAERSLAQSSARVLDQMLDLRLASLELLARSIQEQGVQAQERLLHVQAHRLARHYLEVHGAHVVIGSAGGAVLVDTRVPLGQPLPAMSELAGHSVMAAAMTTGSRAVGDAFRDHPAQTEAVAAAVAIPLLLRHPQQLAVMSIVETAEFQRRIEQHALPQAWSLSLLDSTGRALVRTGPSAPVTWRQAPLEEKRSVRVGLAQAPWTLELQAPAASPLDSSRLQAGLLLLAMVATVALAYWTGRLASRRLTLALASLTDPSSATPHAKDIDEIRDVRDQMLSLQRQRQQAQERERQRIGLELHDDLQQRLAVLRQEVALMRQSPSMSEPLPAQTSTFLLRQIDEAIAATRRLINDLHPPVLDDFGVAEGLRLLAQQLQESHGLNIDLHVMAEERAAQLPKPVAIALYRVTQEALNNVRKHAQASVVHVTLDLRKPDAAELEIVDDGAGFEVLSGDTPETHGLRGMLERVQALRGSLKIQSQPGEGTAILVHLPIAPAAAPSIPSAPETPAVTPTPAGTGVAAP